MKCTSQQAAERLWLVVAPVPQASVRECRCGQLSDPLACHWLGRGSRSVVLRTLHDTEVLQRSATVLHMDSWWTEVVAEPPFPVGAQAPALRPDLRGTSVASRAPLSEDMSMVASTDAAHVSHMAGSPRFPRAAQVREAEKVGKYTPHLPAGDPPHALTPLV